MKLLDILKEIGEGSKEPYPYKRSQYVDSSIFTWTTEEGIPYEMIIDKEDYYSRPDDVYDISFGIVTIKKRNSTSFKQIDHKATSKDTKTGNLYRTMATVVDIVKKEIALDKEEGSGPDMLTFSPTKEDESDDRRLKLYAAYIKKQMPEAEIVISRNGTITVYL